MSSQYHIFFTKNYANQCLEFGRFGANASNVLANVKQGDTAFLFDISCNKIFGALKIKSCSQFYENTDVFGYKKNLISRFPNRVSFEVDNISELKLVDFFALEAGCDAIEFHINRNILALIKGNKQVNSTTLTEIEGCYLKNKITKHGTSLNITPEMISHSPCQSVYQRMFSSRNHRSEAIFEMMLLTQKPSTIFSNQEKMKVYNQFIVGFQRIIDLVIVSDLGVEIIEIKMRENHQNPFDQVSEYIKYAAYDLRFKIENFPIDRFFPIVLLEMGNMYLDEEYIPHIPGLIVYSFTFNSNYEINLNKFWPRIN